MKRLGCFAMAAIFMVLATPFGFAAVSAGVGISTNGLLVYYDLNNPGSYNGSTTLSNLADSGSTNNATIVGSPTYTRGVSGSYLTLTGGSGSLYTASATNHHLTLGTTNFDFSNGFSISFLGSLGAADNWERIFDFGNGDQNGSFLLSRQGTASNLFYESWGTDKISKGNCVTNTGVLPGDNTIQQITLTISSTGACQYYVNGSAVTSTKSVSNADIRPVNVSRSYNFIGRSEWSSDNFMAGVIIRLAMYNRQLSSSEVTQNYNSMIDLTYPNAFSGGNNSVNENSISGTTITANETSSYSLISGGANGADSSLFNIDSITGVVTFKSAPNFEAPVDAGANNVYNITVRAIDLNGNHNDYSFTITVLNVAEFATISTPLLSAAAFKGVYVTITVTPSAGGTAGKISYFMEGKRIPGCINLSFSGSGNSTCLWKPPTMGSRVIKVTFTPNGSEYGANSSSSQVRVIKRSNTR